MDTGIPTTITIDKTQQICPSTTVNSSLVTPYLITDSQVQPAQHHLQNEIHRQKNRLLTYLEPTAIQQPTNSSSRQRILQATFQLAHTFSFVPISYSPQELQNFEYIK